MRLIINLETEGNYFIESICNSYARFKSLGNAEKLAYLDYFKSGNIEGDFENLNDIIIETFVYENIQDAYNDHSDTYEDLQDFQDAIYYFTAYNNYVIMNI